MDAPVDAFSYCPVGEHPVHVNRLQRYSPNEWYRRSDYSDPGGPDRRNRTKDPHDASPSSARYYGMA